MKKYNSMSEPTGLSLISFAMEIPGAEGIKRSLKKQGEIREWFFLVCSFLSLIVDSGGKCSAGSLRHFSEKREALYARWRGWFT
jgi:hypothetical protein